MFAGSMPKSTTRFSFVDTATKCFATALSSTPSLPSSQVRASRALVSVSCVPNVFDTTTNSVDAGSRSCVFTARSVGSMLDTNRAVMPASR